MKTTKVFNVRVPIEWAKILEAEAEHNHLKISDVFREMILSWWKMQLTENPVMHFNPSTLTGDSLKKMEFIAKQYNLEEYLAKAYSDSPKVKDLEEVDIRDDGVRFKIKK